MLQSFTSCFPLRWPLQSKQKQSQWPILTRASPIKFSSRMSIQHVLPSSYIYLFCFWLFFFVCTLPLISVALELWEYACNHKWSRPSIMRSSLQSVAFLHSQCAVAKSMPIICLTHASIACTNSICTMKYWSQRASKTAL